MQKFSYVQKIAAFTVFAAMCVIQLTTVPQVKAQATSDLAPFTPGNLVVYRVGDGTGTLSNTGNAVFLDEFTPTGTLVQSIALPTTVSGANRQLLASGTATSEGFLTRSSDGRFLFFTGYGRDLGGTTNITSTTSADVPRVVGRVDANGVVDTSTAITDTFSATNIRSVVSTNGTDIWATGGNGGVRYTTLGSSTTTQINTGANPNPQITNLRQINIYNNQLYYSTGSGTNPRVGAVGTGTPTTNGQDLLPLAGVSGSGSPYGFFLADLSAAVPGVDTLYIADDNGTTGGIQKYSLVGSTWTANGTVGTAADAYRGLTGVVSGTTVTLYSTRKGGSGAAGGGELVSLVDSTGYNVTITATPNLLATAVTNTAFRGVALAPTGGTVVIPRKQFDFDGDGQADISVFRPTGGFWYLNRSTAGFSAVQFGASTDRIVPADYDGDGKTDVAVYRDGSWFITNSSNGSFRAVNFGVAGDIPLPFDFDGDFKADIAVFRQGVWYIQQSSDNGFRAVNFGLATDKPVPADFDGDSKADIAVFRDGNWFYTRSSDSAFRAVQFGAAGDKPVAADFDGDGRADQVVFRGGIWYLNRSTAGFGAVNFGLASDVLVPADYDGDGKFDIAVYRDGSWFITNSSNGSFRAVNFGLASDRPIPSSFLQ